MIEANHEDRTVHVNLTEEEIQANFAGQLKKEMTMPLVPLLAKVFQSFSQRSEGVRVPVLMPKHFSATKGEQCVRCSFKASSGFLFPMAKFFVFIHQPTVVINFSEIENVEFKRLEAGEISKDNFDSLTISLLPGSAMDTKVRTLCSVC